MKTNDSLWQVVVAVCPSAVRAALRDGVEGLLYLVCWNLAGAELVGAFEALVAIAAPATVVEDYLAIYLTCLGARFVGLARAPLLVNLMPHVPPLGVIAGDPTNGALTDVVLARLFHGLICVTFAKVAISLACTLVEDFSAIYRTRFDEPLVRLEPAPSLVKRMVEAPPLGVIAGDRPNVAFTGIVRLRLSHGHICVTLARGFI